jgi:hypothetical protein
MTDYKAAQMPPSSSPKLLRFVMDWVWTTAIGWIGSVPFILVAAFIQATPTVSSYKAQQVDYQPQPLWLGDVLCLLTLFAADIAIICIYGFTQWKVAFCPYISKRTWIAATLVSILAGGIVCIKAASLLPPAFYTYGGNYSGLDVSLAVRETWYSTLALGGIVGIFISLPQWWVLRKAFRRSIYWFAALILASSIAAVFTVPAALILENIYLAVACSCVGMPLIFGLLTGVMLHQLLQHSKFIKE